VHGSRLREGISLRHTRAVSRGLMIEARDGGLALVGADGTVLSGLALRLRVGDRVVTGPLVAIDAPAARAHDGAGEYQAARWRLEAEGVEAELELRRYASPQVVVGVLHYRGPALAAERGSAR
jgi:hypothetical protein